MPVAHTTTIERIARVFAARGRANDASEGLAPIGGNENWPMFAQDAIAVLKALREPDAAMAAAGDVDIWRRMVCVALGEEPPHFVPDHGEIYQKPLG